MNQELYRVIKPIERNPDNEGIYFVILQDDEKDAIGYKEFNEGDGIEWFEEPKYWLEKVEADQQELWGKAEDIFDKHTAPTGGGYEADYTSKGSFFNELQENFTLIPKQ